MATLPISVPGNLAAAPILLFAGSGTVQTTVPLLVVQINSGGTAPANFAAAAAVHSLSPIGGDGLHSLTSVDGSWYAWRGDGIAAAIPVVCTQDDSTA